MSKAAKDSSSNKSGFMKSAISNLVTLAAVIAFVVAFSMVFGSDNAIVGVGVVVIALMLLGKDLTAQPVSNGAWLVVFFVALGVAAFLSTINPWVGLVVDFAVVFVVCFLTVSDLERPFYFPFLLTYFFMVYVAPVGLQNVDQLPMRLLSLLVGALGTIGIQLAFNRTRVSTVVQSQFAAIAGTIAEAARSRSEGSSVDVAGTVDAQVSALTHALWERRTGGFRLSLGGQAVTELMSSMERVAELLGSASDDDLATVGGASFLTQVADAFASFPEGKDDWGRDDASAFSSALREAARTAEGNADTAIDAALLLGSLEAVATDFDALLDLPSEQGGTKRSSSKVPGFTFIDLVKSEFKRGTLRFNFAMRMAILLSVIPLAMTLLMPVVPQFEHGRWAVFTLISVVQPISDMTKQRAGQRILGTVIGAVAFMLVFAVVKDATVRSVLVIIASYINSFQPTYIRQMPFITFMALGAAAGSQTVGIDSLSVWRIVLIAGAAVLGTFASGVLFPYRLAEASRKLAQRHLEVTSTLLSLVASKITRTVDAEQQQTFSTLVLASNLIEEQLVSNSARLNGDAVSEFVLAQRSAVAEGTRLYVDADRFTDTTRVGDLVSRLAGSVSAMRSGKDVHAENTALRAEGVALYSSDSAPGDRFGGAMVTAIAQSLLDTPAPATIGAKGAD